MFHCCDLHVMIRAAFGHLHVAPPILILHPFTVLFAVLLCCFCFCCCICVCHFSAPLLIRSAASRLLLRFALFLLSLSGKPIAAVAARPPVIRRHSFGRRGTLLGKIGCRRSHIPEHKWGEQCQCKCGWMDGRFAVPRSSQTTSGRYYWRRWQQQGKERERQ
jgi:hypothetical protein